MFPFPRLDFVNGLERQISQALIKESNKNESFGCLCSQNLNMFAILLQFLALMTLSLPAAGVQKAMTAQHKGNINSSSLAFKEGQEVRGVYLWVIHRANTDSLPSTVVPDYASAHPTDPL